MLKRIMAAVLLLMLGAGALAAEIDPSVLPGEGAKFTAEVISDIMHCYAGPGEETIYLGRLKKGTQVDIMDFGGGWAQIRYRGRIGYAQVADMASNRRMLQYVNAESVPVYWEAHVFSNSPGSLKANQQVWLVGAKDGYWLIENDSGSIKVYIERDKIDGIGLLAPGEARTSNITFSYR